MKGNGWKAIAILSLVALAITVVAGIAVTSWSLARELPEAPVEVITESLDKQVVESVRSDEEIVLVSLGVQGLTEENAKTKILGLDVPGSGRTTFVQYSYRAKLGIDGSRVEIDPLSETHYKVTVPPFIFIGHDDAEFKTALEDNGVLSWTTPEIDTAQAITKVLDSDAKAKHITDNRDILTEQTEEFYEGIVRAVDPSITLEFDYSDET